MPGSRRVDARAQVDADEEEIADQIEDLVANELVLEAQLVLDHLSFGDHEGVVVVRPFAEPRRPELLAFRLEARRRVTRPASTDGGARRGAGSR